MRKSIAAAAIVAAAAATSACGHDRHDDGGPSVSRNYQVGAFQQIEVAGPYDVEVRTGANPTVAANGSEKLLARTVVEVKGDTLSIHPEEQKGWFHTGWHHGKAKFVVTVPELRGATIAGSGGLELASTEVQTLKLSIGGSGGIQAGSGKVKNAEY